MARRTEQKKPREDAFDGFNTWLTMVGAQKEHDDNNDLVDALKKSRMRHEEVYVLRDLILRALQYDRDTRRVRALEAVEKALQ